MPRKTLDPTTDPWTTPPPGAPPVAAPTGVIPRVAETKTETGFVHKLLVRLNKVPGVRVHRQNVANVPITSKNARGEDVTRHVTAGAPAGAADITGLVAPEGWRLEIEVKRPRNKKRSPAQVKWEHLIREGGGIYMLFVMKQGYRDEENLVLATTRLTALIGERRTQGLPTPALAQEILRRSHVAMREAHGPRVKPMCPCDVCLTYRRAESLRDAMRA